MKLSIRQSDIDRGLRGSPCRCPVALAARRELPRTPVVWAGAVRLYVLPRDGRWIEKELPQRLKDWIQRYDNNRYVQPIEVEL